MKKINTALIGCGRIGYLLEADPLRNKPCTHFGGALSAGLKIDLACDTNKERLNDFSRKANIPEENRFTSYKDLLILKRPHLVIIATWTESHADIGICAAENGAGVILCEKPIAHDLKHASELLKCCNMYNVKLVINHERRYDNRYNTVKKLLDNGEIGIVKTVYASILTSGSGISSRNEPGGGPLLHDGTHLIDLIRFYFGEIKSVEGEFQRNGRERGYEDRATAWMKTDGGVDIFVEAGGTRDYFVFELQISGTKGKIIIGNGYEKVFINKKSVLYSGFKDLYERPFPARKGINCFKKEYLEVKKLLFKGKMGVTSTGQDGYKALETIHAIYLSASLNKKKIELPVNPDRINIRKIFNL